VMKPASDRRQSLAAPGDQRDPSTCSIECLRRGSPDPPRRTSNEGSTTFQWGRARASGDHRCADG
jgi:hypothetical protein